MIFYFSLSPSPQKREAMRMAGFKPDILYSFFYMREQDFKEVRPGVYRKHPTTDKKPENMIPTLRRGGAENLPEVFRVSDLKKGKKK